MDKLLNKYEEMFGECFPLMLTRGMSEEQKIDIIKSCLNKKEPYEVGTENDY